MGTPINLKLLTKLLINVRSRGKKIGKKQTRMSIVGDSWILGFKVMVIFFFLVYKFSVYTTMPTAASPTRGTRVWANSRSWSWTGKPGVLQSTGSQRVGHDGVAEQDKIPVPSEVWSFHIISPSVLHMTYITISSFPSPSERFSFSPQLWLPLGTLLVFSVSFE